MHGDTKMVKLLLALGADATLCDGFSHTGLQSALLLQYAETAEAFFDFAAHPLAAKTFLDDLENQRPGVRHCMHAFTWLRIVLLIVCLCSLLHVQTAVAGRESDDGYVSFLQLLAVYIRTIFRCSSVASDVLEQERNQLVTDLHALLVCMN